MTSSSEFFKKMTEENKSASGFSQRSLSTYLEWPVSYIPDVIKERKPFTVARCLEFVRKFKVNPIDAERLIFLAVASQSKIDFESLNSLRVEKNPNLRLNDVDIDLFSFEVLYVLEIVRWFHGKATKKNISAIIPEKKINSLQIENTLNLLVKKKIIKETKGFYKAVDEGLFTDQTLAPAQEKLLHQKFAENLKQFYDYLDTPACGSTSFVQIDVSRFIEIRDKITSLRNWIQEISKIDSQKSQSQDILLFQLDFYLTPQFNVKKGASAKKLMEK